MAAVESDADLLTDLNRALRSPLVSFQTRAACGRRVAESERLLKSVAKQLAQRAGEVAGDRRSRELIRVRVYTTLVPMLLELRAAHDATVSLARRAVFAGLGIGIALALIGLIV